MTVGLTLIIAMTVASNSSMFMLGAFSEELVISPTGTVLVAGVENGREPDETEEDNRKQRPIPPDNQDTPTKKRKGNDEKK